MYAHDPRLAYYLSIWELTKPQMFASTPTSTVYKVQRQQQTMVLKLLTELGMKDEQRGALALRFFAGQGAVSLFEADTGAHLLDYIDGPALSTLSLQGEDATATKIIASILNQLHAPRSQPFPVQLTALRRWFRSLFRQAEADATSHSMFQRAAQLAEELLNKPQDVAVLHGDIHHDNIKHSSAHGWLAFDPKGLVGERTFDAANTLCNPTHIPALVLTEARLLGTAEILAAGMRIALDRLLAFAFVYACLSACWTLEDGGDAAVALGVAQIIEKQLW